MTKRLSWIGVLTLLGCTANYGAIITTPTGLAPGSTYQLVFVTADPSFATSTSISTYNSFVTTEAAGNATLAAFDTANSVTWTVIGSTQTVAASSNAPSSGAVYTLDGTKVASAGLYSGSLLAPIDITQNGATLSTGVWTGATSSGGMAGGINDLGQTFPEFGSSSLTTSAWIADANGTESDNNAALYALSSVITVPPATGTPEPGTMALVPVAFCLFAAARRRRQRY